MPNKRVNMDVFFAPSSLQSHQLRGRYGLRDYMEIPIDNELKGICLEIASEGLSEMRWAEIESFDMFQTTKFCGGYDSDEGEFCFSFFDVDKKEYWFQFSLELALSISNGADVKLVGREADY